VIVLRDITEERELQQVRDSLSSMIVHDLRGPRDPDRVDVRA